MKNIEALEAKYKQAMAELARAVGEAFPVGTRVAVERGAGVLHVTVHSAPCSWAEPTRIGVTTRNGKYISVDYKACRKEQP